jgi:2'-5' RNA ligase
MDETQDTHQRLFFALWPTEDDRRALARWRDALPRSGGRPTAAGDLHLTLAFAGDVDAGTRNCLEQTAARVQGEPFTLRLDRLGLFKRGLLWTGPTDCPLALSSLAQHLAAVLRDCGVRPDPRPFHPHITLIRRMVGRLPGVDPPGLIWQVQAFCLVRSRPGQGYQVLRTYPLLGPTPGSLSERSGSMG